MVHTFPTDPSELTVLARLKRAVMGSLFWNAFESILYQILYLSHHTALFYNADRNLYGIYGALFAFLYLVIMWVNTSFDVGVIPFFSVFSENKKNFKHLISSYLIPQMFLVAGLSGLVGSALMAYKGRPTFLNSYLDYSSLLCFVFFITAESMKKNMRALLQLGFQNKITAWIEVTNIALYVATVWILYFCGIPFSLLMLTAPFMIISFLTAVVLGVFLYRYYCTLPNLPKTIPLTLPKRVLITRLFLFINQVGNSLFSSNFLLPLFACQIGLTMTGTASFVNTITFSLTFFIQRVFGPSGAALFARTKLLSAESKQLAFKFLYKKCWYLVICVITLFLINGRSVILMHSGQKEIALWVVIAIFCVSHVLETLFILYDKLFAAEEQSHYVALINTVSFVLSMLVASYNCTYGSLITTLLSCAIIRFGAFFYLTILAHKLWNLSFSYALSLNKVLPPLIVSLVIAFIIHVYQ